MCVSVNYIPDFRLRAEKEGRIPLTYITYITNIIIMFDIIFKDVRLKKK